MQSQKNSLNNEDWIKIQNNFFRFADKVFIIYLGSISAILAQPDHLITSQDFIPNPIVLGMMVKQLIDTATDIFTKYLAGQ